MQSHQKPEPVVDNAVKVSIAAILEERFPNGIRPNSIIDINKLKKFYTEITDKEISSEINLPVLLDSIGFRHGEKIFAVSSDGKQCLVDLLDRLIAKNNQLFYYDEFYSAHMDFFLKIHIFSSGLLKIVLINIVPSLYYSKNFFSTSNDVTVESEVLRCFETAVCQSYEQLNAKLPYVPLDKIKQVLIQDDFLRVNMSIYTHVSKVGIDKNEQDYAKNKVKAEIAERGFASLLSFDVSASFEINPELSETALRNGLFQKHLADCYEKRWNVITPKGMVLNAPAILEYYCTMHKRLSLDELLAFEEEINGRVSNQALLAAYETMIRVDKDTFVANDEICFDAEMADNALTLFVHNDVIPLRTVTSFTSFPYIEGYQWNLYLLESYCRRFSKRFMYQCLSVNSRNIGAIFRKSANFADYTGVLASAVTVSNIELNDKVVGDYLFERGYVAQRIGSTISKVVAKAQYFRQKRF